MSSLLLLFACLALGMAVARWGRPPAALAQALNWWVIQIALPALVLELIPQIRFAGALGFLAATSWIVLLGGWALMAWLGRLLHWPRARVGALILVSGLGNTAFVGYPMIEALRGPDALKLAVIADQTGSFTALAIGGVAVTSLYAGERFALGAVLRRILLFPSTVALVCALIAGRFGGWPDLLQGLFERVGTTLTPLAMFSVGLQQRLRWSRSQLPALVPAIAWKLLLAPALCALLGRITGVGGAVMAVGVLQAAMPSMVSATILADQYELEPALANAVLGLSLVLSLAILPAINALL